MLITASMVWDFSQSDAATPDLSANHPALQVSLKLFFGEKVLTIRARSACCDCRHHRTD